MGFSAPLRAVRRQLRPDAPRLSGQGAAGEAPTAPQPLGSGFASDRDDLALAKPCRYAKAADLRLNSTVVWSRDGVSIGSNINHIRGYC
jgi:hypothetical protein